MIGECAFSENTSLTSVTLPESVIDIGGGAFYLCHHLDSVTVLNENCSIHDDTTSLNEPSMPAIMCNKIRGYAGSTAERYAYGIEFEPIAKTE